MEQRRLAKQFRQHVRPGTPSGTPIDLVLLVLQSEQLCNLDCTYCYLPFRNMPGRMSREVIEATAKLVARSNVTYGRRGSLNILWHAGEPLIAPPDYYEDAISVFRQHLPKIKLHQTFQTNGTLINAAWIEYFQQHGANVGVSLDGPEWLHDITRLNRGKRGSFEKCIRGIKLLQQSGLSFGVLAVLTRESLRHPRELFEFYTDLSVSDVSFNVEQAEGLHLVSSLSDKVHFGEAVRFFEAFFRLNEEAGFPLRVREYNEMLSYIERFKLNSDFFPSQAEQRPLAIITVSHNGELSTFSPELATTPGYLDGGFSLGNVQSIGSLDGLRCSERLNRLSASIAAGIKACESACAYFPFCGGGSPSNKFYENHDLASTESPQCVYQRQAVADALLRLLSCPDAK